MDGYRGMDYLKTKLSTKRTRVLRRYKFYEMKNVTKDLGISVPEHLRLWSQSLGWCAKTVDALADRLVFREFRNDNFGMNEIFQMNNPDVLFDSAMTSALISSCCFIYISLGEDEFPRLQVIDGGNATGIMDPITGLLKEGYAVLERDDNNSPVVEAHFLPGITEIHRKGKKDPERLENSAPAPLLVPIVHRPDAKRVFGHSRISRACMSLMSSAIRTIKRSEISAEFYSFPQKYAAGLSQDAEAMDKWKATISSFIQITKDEDGDSPTLGQFQQQSMAPHTEQLKMFAALFAGESGLTMDDIGFVTDNPSSADAIRASHENLRLAARKAQRTFGSGLLNAGYLAACIRDDYPYFRNQIYMTKPVWEPIFEPDAAMTSLIGDGAIKINQAVPGYFGKDNLRDLTGIDPSTTTTSVAQGIEEVQNE